MGSLRTVLNFEESLKTNNHSLGRVLGLEKVWPWPCPRRLGQGLEVTLKLYWLFPVLTVMTSLEVASLKHWNCLSEHFYGFYHLDKIKLAFHVHNKIVLLTLLTYLVALVLASKTTGLGPGLGLENAGLECSPANYGRIRISAGFSICGSRSTKPRDIQPDPGPDMDLLHP